MLIWSWHILLESRGFFLRQIDNPQMQGKGHWWYEKYWYDNFIKLFKSVETLQFGDDNLNLFLDFSSLTCTLAPLLGFGTAYFPLLNGIYQQIIPETANEGPQGLNWYWTFSKNWNQLSNVANRKLTVALPTPHVGVHPTFTHFSDLPGSHRHLCQCLRCLQHGVLHWIMLTAFGTGLRARICWFITVQT